MTFTRFFPRNDSGSYPWAIIKHQEIGHTVCCRFSDKETARYYLKSYRRQHPGSKLEVKFLRYDYQ